ncbi:MAG: DNA helicase RecQ [Lachnospiraceae bacterium]
MDKREVLKTTFGYEQFRPGQEELIDGILAGRDVLGIMPTGAGKSLCYQVPALCLPGVSIVVSPLISLMKDQVQALNAAGVHAAYLNSSLSENQIAKAISLAAGGRYKIIYVAPERLLTQRFLWLSRQIEIPLVCVDEAHCVSQWGQDFRPSYLAIADYVKTLKKRPAVAAFTATATKEVREDIIRALELSNPLVRVTGFDRKNLYWRVEQPRNKTAFVLSYLRAHENESGIIYCNTRKNVDQLYGILRDERIPAGRYHAGMEQEERVRSQDDFIYDNISVMVATNAFGMGIDKSNVRFVIHYNMPSSLENYYQEAGRAGRDGESAECILLYSPQDVVIGRVMLEGKTGNEQMTAEELATVQQQDVVRLRRMEHYCTCTTCLRNEILSYFGEKVGAPCGACGNCAKHYEEKDVTKSAEAVLTLVRAIPGRFGPAVVASALHGDKTKRILDAGLAEKPGFGALAAYPEGEIRVLLTSLEEVGIIARTVDRYGLVVPGKDAANVLAGGKVLIRIPESAGGETSTSHKRAKLPKGTTILSEEGIGLFAKLRSLRLQLARKQGIPPYMIFSDKTLTDLAVRLPRTKEDMREVSGVGEKKLESYGDAFLAVIRDYLDGYAAAHGGKPPVTTA